MKDGLKNVYHVNINENIPELKANKIIHVAKLEFCGITQQKDVTMTSTGKGESKEV